MIKTYLLSFLLFAFSLQAQEKILFIGNSYTGQIKKTVQEMFHHNNSDAKLEFVHPGGKTLQFHIANPQTIAIIKNGQWDKIILQDQSQTPALPKYNQIFHSAVDKFQELFKTLNKKPEIYFYLTWGRRDGDKKNLKVFPNFSIMQEALSNNYSKAASRISAHLAPVGHGFKYIHDHHKTLFKDLYSKDGSHPGKYGAYLAACIFYSVLMNQKPLEISWDNKLEPQTALILRQAAQKAIP